MATDNDDTRDLIEDDGDYDEPPLPDEWIRPDDDDPIGIPDLSTEDIVEKPHVGLGLILSPEQTFAVMAVTKWFQLGAKSPSEFKLGGYAGTGKTTVIKSILKMLDSDACIALLAFTGKAVSVLRRKGCPDASTIHSAIYIPHENPKTHEITYALRPDIEADLIIVDEASMVSRDLYLDLKSFGCKILWVGDPGQLEPVGDDVKLMADPDIILSKIHRQGAGSSILVLAESVRSGVSPIRWLLEGEKDVLERARSLGEVTISRWPSGITPIDSDVVICGYNKTRVTFNKRIREARGFTTPIPFPGERVICLKNNANAEVFNGMLLTVGFSTYNERDPNVVDMILTSELGKNYKVKAWIPQFNSLETIELPTIKTLCKLHDLRTLTFFDYGYALTAHKSQGSEFDHVSVFEEIWTEKWDSRRWRYTAITRAAKTLKYYYR